MSAPSSTARPPLTHSSARPPLAAPDLWLLVQSSISAADVTGLIETWMRQLPFPHCKPNSGSHTPETYRASVLRRCCIAYDRVRWCYSEVLLQYYRLENVIRVKGLFRSPPAVKMWPTAFTDTIKVWQVKRDLVLRQNTSCRSLTETDTEFYEMEPRPLDEVHAGSEVYFYATHFPETKRFRQCLLLTDAERNCAKEEFMSRILGEGGTENKNRVVRYLYENNLYGAICVDKPGGNYILWIPSELSNQTGVSVKADLHYMEVKSEEIYPKKEYVGSKTVSLADCQDMSSVFRTFDFPGKNADLDKFFWSYKIPW